MPGLIAMSSGDPLVIGPDGQQVLANWFVKSVVVRELVTPLGSPYRISTAEQRQFIASGRVPPGWRVVIGAYEGDGPNLEHHFGTVKQHLDQNGSALGKIALHTIRFECLVGQVLIHSTPDLPEADHLLGGPSFALGIPSDQPVTWPPQRTLNAEWMKSVKDFGPAPS